MTFGTEPARVDSQLIELLRTRNEEIEHTPIKLHQSGDRVVINEGPFAGIEGVFEMTDGESRALVLIELLSKVTRLKLPIKDLTKID